jgi:hypothetical protein
VLAKKHSAAPVNVYERSSADGATNWSAEVSMIQATPNRNDQTAAGFDHPYGDYAGTVTDGRGSFFAVWAERESKAGSGDA